MSYRQLLEGSHRGEYKPLPASRIYHVWSTGARFTGGYIEPYYHGSAEATSFRAACKEVLKENKYYNLESNTYWGCALYDQPPNGSYS